MPENRSGIGQTDLQAALFGLRLSDLYTRQRLLFDLKFEQVPGQENGASTSLAEAAGRLRASPTLPWAIDRDLQMAAQAAAQQYTWDLEACASADVSRLRLLTNRAQAHAVCASDFSAAFNDIEEVLRQDDWHPRALLLKARLEFYSGDLAAAAATVKRVSGSEATPAAVVLAETMLAAGELEKPALIYQRLNATSSLDDRSFERARLLRLHSGRRQINDFSTLALLLTSRERAAPLVVLTVAEHELLFGKPENARAALEEALQGTVGNNRDWLAWQLGRVLFMTGNPLGASDWYAEFLPDESDSLAHREYVHVLFKAQLLSAAHRRARAIRAAQGDVVVGITEIEANCLLAADQPEEAAALLDALATKQPYMEPASP